MARGVALAAAIAVSLLAVSGAGGAPAQTPKRGGTIVVGTLREPPCLNAWFQRCHGNTPPAGLIMDLALRGAFKVGTRFSWQYDLVSGVEYTTTPPFTLTFRIRHEARWSDGVPDHCPGLRVHTRHAVAPPGVGAGGSRPRVRPQRAGGRFEARSAVVEHFPPGRRAGIASFDPSRRVDAKTVRVVLRERTADWRTLFPRLAEHALRGQDLEESGATGWTTRRRGGRSEAVRSCSRSWQRGRAVTLVRNPRYWGPTSPISTGSSSASAEPAALGTPPRSRRSQAGRARHRRARVTR